MTQLLLPILIVAIVGLYTIHRRRVLFYANLAPDQVIPMSSTPHKILITMDSSDSMTVWSSTQRKLYKITKDGHRWHIQTPSGKNAATVKHTFQEKYIVLAASSPVSDAPLVTTPSVIRMDTTLFSNTNRFKEYKFSFGAEPFLRWCGMDHFEIVTDLQDDADGLQSVRQRVAFCDGVVENSVALLFDYNEINLEVLVSTFLLSLLCEKSLLNKARGYSRAQSLEEKCHFKV